MAAIILLVGTRAGKGNLILAAIFIEALVDELTAIVRINTQQGEGKILAYSMDCLP
jgi:hypothetical protein